MSMTRFRRHLLAVALALIAVAAHAADTDRRAVLVDIRTATAAEVDAWRTAAGVDWWLELGDELLLSGDVSAMRRAIARDVVLRDLGKFEPQDLVLHARGCAVDLTPPDLLVYPGSRYDLLLRPDAARMAALGHGDPAHVGADEWVEVQPNSVIARQYRFERPRALPADPAISMLVAEVDTARWFADVEMLASWDRSSFSPELATARQWIAARFAALGLEVSEPSFSLVYGATTYTPSNVIGRLVGATRPDDWVIVGGHYDSRNAINSPAYAADTPGADDNATGCSAVLELARIFSRKRPAATMFFMCYAGEEQGLVGSGAHAAGLQASGELSKVRLAAIMDMIGWSPNATLGADLDTTSANLATRNLFADAALTYVPELAITVSPLTCCSDHMPYINRGRPGILSIHRSYTGYVHYHKSTDLPANLGSHAQAIGGAIMKMNVAAVASVAGPMDRIFSHDFDD
ncbi:MAG TPA: M28 family peptidase [Dokdonella sp.]|uniref:M28 family metallopeptidase n=1 Tax=Dokdonella sp. TaxID=2291710 RepID=UPI002B77D0E1|nr:M28 family peptidase [Dokdonella sp.]HNR92174.1 M28 family peptidase [Dokdonella sp.]